MPKTVSLIVFSSHHYMSKQSVCLSYMSRLRIITQIYTNLVLKWGVRCSKHWLHGCVSVSTWEILSSPSNHCEGKQPSWAVTWPWQDLLLQRYTLLCNQWSKRENPSCSTSESQSRVVTALNRLSRKGNPVLCNHLYCISDKEAGMLGNIHPAPSGLLPVFQWLEERVAAGLTDLV